MDRNLFEIALTHSTYAYEQGVEHNERLEYLGDAVLQLCVSQLLCESLPDAREGELSKLRQRLVNKDVLAQLASELGLGQGLRVGKGQAAHAMRDQAKPLSDAWEALLGAVYLELGLPAAMQVVAETLLPRIDQPAPLANPKSRLQEWCQRNHAGAVPDYVEVDRSGPDHQPEFTVEVQLAGRTMGRGQGLSRKAAEQAAARQALARIQGQPA